MIETGWRAYPSGNQRRRASLLLPARGLTAGEWDRRASRPGHRGRHAPGPRGGDHHLVGPNRVRPGFGLPTRAAGRVPHRLDRVARASRMTAFEPAGVLRGPQAPVVLDIRGTAELVDGAIYRARHIPLAQLPGPVGRDPTRPTAGRALRGRATTPASRQPATARRLDRRSPTCSVGTPHGQRSRRHPSADQHRDGSATRAPGRIPGASAPPGSAVVSSERLHGPGC